MRRPRLGGCLSVLFAACTLGWGLTLLSGGVVAYTGSLDRCTNGVERESSRFTVRHERVGWRLGTYCTIVPPGETQPRRVYVPPETRDWVSVVVLAVMFGGMTAVALVGLIVLAGPDALKRPGP